MDKKIISLQNFSEKKIFKKYVGTNLRRKILMLFLVMIIGAFCGLFSWQYFVENVARLDVKIPQSKEIAFNNSTPLALTTSQIANEFEKSDERPILLYIYTTWCKICSKNFATINEISREFQNTELNVIAIAIDRDMSEKELSDYLNQFGNFYFQPRFLAFKQGFKEFLYKKNIPYNGYIPYTALISRDGKIITKFSGSKNLTYLRNKIINELYL